MEPTTDGAVPAPLYHDEPARMAVLRDYGVLDSVPEARYATAAEMERAVAFCAHAILQPADIFVVPDALADPRFATNPLVQDEPRMRFYAGAPLVSPEGMPLGTLCVFDRVPRALSAEQTRALGALAREVVIHLELRRVLATLDGPSPDPSGDVMLDPDVRDELQQASQSAANASALVAEAMERALEAERRMRNLVYRVRSRPRRPPPAPSPGS